VTAGHRRRPGLGDADRSILRIAVPALGSLAIDPLLTMTDTAFVARLGTTDLAALGVDAAILSFAFFAFNFLAFATTPLVAKALGKGDREEAGSYVGTALALAVILGLMVTVVVQVLAPVLVGAMGAEGEVFERAVGYLRIRALATVAVLVVLSGHGSFRGHKDTRTPLLVAAGANLVNLALDPILIFVVGLGLAGAAWATVIAQTVGAVWFVTLIWRRRMARMPRRLGESLPAVLTLGRNGALLTTRSAFLLATFAVAASTATRLGPDQIAAHQLVFQLFILSVMVADALEIAGQALVAEASASGDVAGLRDLTRRLLGWGLGVGVFLLVLVLLGRHGLALLAGDASVAARAVSAAGVAAVTLPLGSLVFVSDGVFSGLLAFGTMALSTGVGSVVAVALMVWSPLGNTLEGVWWAIGVFLVVRGLVFIARYRGSVEMAVRS
jgi:putative MATE family efflux protein